jgi:hypothetical protein
MAGFRYSLTGEKVLTGLLMIGCQTSRRGGYGSPVEECPHRRGGHEEPRERQGDVQGARIRKGGREVKVKQAVLWAVIIFIAWFVISSPSSAGSIVHDAFTWVSNTGHSLGSAIHQLVS